MPRGHIVLREFRGVNLSVNPRYLPDGDLVKAQDTYQPLPGWLQLRPQTQLITSINATGSYVVDTMVYMPFDDARRQHHTMLWHEDGNYARVLELLPDNTASIFVSTGLWSGKERPAWFVFNRELYILTGADKPGFIIYADPNSFAGGLLVKDAFTGWSSQIRPSIAAVYRDQLCVAGLAPPDESLIRLTNPLAVANGIDTLLGLDKSISVAASDGDRIVGLYQVPVIGGGSYVEPYLLVFKRRSVWMVQGNLPTQNLEGSATTVPLVRDEGLVSKETICPTPYGTAWCSGENVWVAPHGGVPIPIGADIREHIRRLPGGDRASWFMVYYKGFLRLQIPKVTGLVATATTEGEYGAQYNEQYWCDMRNFPKVSWWGPMTIPCAASAVDTVGDNQRLLMAFSRYRAPNSTVYFVEGEQQTANHTDAHTNLDGHLAPTMDIRFKEFDFGDPMLDKLVDALELHVWADRATTLTVQMLGDGGSVVSNPTGPNVSGGGFVLDASLLNTGVFSEGFQSLAVFPPSSGRFIAKTWQPIIQTQSTVSVAPEMRLAAFGVRTRPIGRRPGA